MKVIDFFQFLFKLTANKNKLLRDLDALKIELKPLKDILVPFTDEEMELLSTHQTHKSVKKGFAKIHLGVFNSIYFEPLIAYGKKKYSNDNTLILISSSKDEFVYLNRGNKTHIYYNNIEIGIITQDGKMYDLKNSYLGSIDGDDLIRSHAVTIQNKIVGYIMNPRFASVQIPRVFSLLRPMEVNEKIIFLSLSLLNLIEEAQLSKLK